MFITKENNKYVFDTSINDDGVITEGIADVLEYLLNESDPMADSFNLVAPVLSLCEKAIEQAKVDNGIDKDVVIMEVVDTVLQSLNNFTGALFTRASDGTINCSSPFGEEFFLEVLTVIDEGLEDEESLANFREATENDSAKLVEALRPALHIIVDNAVDDVTIDLAELNSKVDKFVDLLLEGR